MSKLMYVHNKTAFRILSLAFVVTFLIGGSIFWKLNSNKEVSTDDAQIDGHVHPISARVGGVVTWVNPAVEDTHYIAAGTIIARLDTRDYQPAVDRLKGDLLSEQSQLENARLLVPITQTTASSKLNSARASVVEAEAEADNARAAEQAAKAQVSQAEASFQRAETDRLRYEKLVSTHEISRSEYDTRKMDAVVARAQLDVAKANLQAAQHRIKVFQQHIAERKEDVASASIAPQLVATAVSNVSRLNGEVQKAQAALKDAQQNIGYTDIVAPISGIIGRRSIEAGQRVAPDQLLLDVVDTSNLWVTANFKETQLRNVACGDHVRFYVDTYKTTVSGTVEGIGGATGAKYALLAPDNATGNYVKVVQRIPVRIRFDAKKTDGHVLLPGMSVEVHIYSR